MANLLPNIGSVGLFTLLAPYDALLLKQVPYTCVAIRRIAEIAVEGKDVFATNYQPYGVTAVKFAQDLAANVSIVSLRSGTGQWVYVPSSYILAFPAMNGVKYTAMMLGVSLGAIPDKLSLVALKTSVGNLVYDTLGVTPVIKEVAVSLPSIIPHADHEVIENARLTQVTIAMSDSAKLAQVTTERNALILKVQALEAYIEANLLP